MRIYIDTEFYEHGNRNYGLITVELISIGAVREDGAEFYAENADFDWDHVPSDHWLQDNVRPHLWHGNNKPLWMVTEGSRPKGGLYAPQDIAWNFRRFANDEFADPEDKPEFWGYFCDYDWVAICGLYGRMIDLPTEFPMYCLDLKQEMVRQHISRTEIEKNILLSAERGPEHHALTDARWIRDAHRVVRDWIRS